jgi:phospholipid/cholesterol/gamma-HCH transport system substrate-binding protein
MTAIRKHARDFGAVIGLAIISLGVGGYILANQRFRFPVFDEKPFKLKAAFSTAQAVTPGQGQTVRVSGVRVGDIAKVDLKDGLAVVTMDIDRKYSDLVHTDAKALLRPKTGLKDMFVDLQPGTNSTPVAKENFTVPVSNTLPDVNPDEVYSALDADTRDYLRLLVNGAGNGLKGRGSDLREVFRRFEPTHRDLARVTGKLAERHQHLRRLIHNLDVLNTELASKGPELAQLIDSSSAVFRAFASEEKNVSSTVHELPSALRQTTGTLGKVQRLAEVLKPTAEALRPAARDLDDANRAVTPLAREAAPIVRDQIRPFVRQARPVVRSLKPASESLANATPDLTRSFKVLNSLFNLIGYNENGRQGPEVAGRDEGMLFWIAWLDHNAASLFATGDANGPFRPVTLGAPCSVLKQMGDENPQLGMVISPALLDPKVCGSK